ncbi:hypothetical protein Sjap_024489 [Stephania japonica]|uniref:Uncharacterized protein n=1 Tax=Stephania japonica TaxID=461633 RepID=A0AAP0EGQ3_9MAGN
MFCVFLFCAFYLFAMMLQQRGRDHVEAALQAEAGEDEPVIIMVADEEPLAPPPVTPPQHLIDSTGAQNHQTDTIHDQEFIRPDSQPSRSLNISNGAEEQHHTINYDRIIDQNRNGLQMPSTTTIQKQIGAVIKYCQLPFSIGIFVVVAGTNLHTEPRNKFFLKLCYASFLVSILTGSILLTLSKQNFRGNVLVLTFIAAIAFALDIAGLCFLTTSYS